MVLYEHDDALEATVRFIAEQSSGELAALWRAAMDGRDCRGWRWVRDGELVSAPSEDADGLWVDYAFEVAEATLASRHVYTLIMLSLTEDERTLCF